MDPGQQDVAYFTKGEHSERGISANRPAFGLLVRLGKKRLDNTKFFGFLASSRLRDFCYGSLKRKGVKTLFGLKRGT